MRSFGSDRMVRILAFGAAAVFGFAFLSDVGRSQTNYLGDSAKLAGPLASLTQSVPQERKGSAEVHPAPGSFNTDSLPKPARDAVVTRQMRIFNGAVQVYILVNEISAGNLRQLQSAGVTIQLQDAKRNVIQALIPISRLAQVSELSCVEFIRLPTYARRRTGSVDTEGDTILHAVDARTNLGIDGTGVRVAALSDGLKGIFASGCTTCQGVAGGPISTQDLPNATGTRDANGILNSSTGGIIGQSFNPVGNTGSNDLEGIPRDNNGNPVACGFAGAGAEGTALLEIIHDIAPGAQLSFANFGTDMEFRQAVNTLAAANDVVVDDIGFFGEPDDGTSDVSTNTASALNGSSNPIRAYVTSVGNDADIHYRGLYTDSGTDGMALTGVSGHLHLFQASPNPPTTDFPATADTLGLGPQTYNEIELQNNGEVVVFLNWDDPWGASTNEYDVYLVQHGTTNVVSGASFSRPQDCFGPGYPVDCFEYVNGTGSQDYFDIVIQNRNNSAAPKHLNLYAFSPECAAATIVTLNPSDPNRAKINFNTRVESVAAESDAGGSPVSVISVAAICSGSSAALSKDPYSCNDPNHDQAEFYSSNGPTLDGRIKPDIAGIDGVSITGAGSFENPFFGTSAAAPHVAGIAALTLQAAPCLLNGGGVTNTTARTNLRNLLLNTADAVGGASPQSPNDIFGSGRINALTSADAALPFFNGSPAITVNGNTMTGATVAASQLGFTDPDTCPITTAEWSNVSGNCGNGGPASGLSCGFGPNNVSVSASNNGVSFSQAASVTINVTDFAVGAAPGSMTVSVGQSAMYTVTVSSTATGAFTNPVALSCSSLPPGASCSFNPPMVTPGAAGQTSTLTVSTVQTSSTAPLLTVPGHRRAPWAPSFEPFQGIPVAAWLALAVFSLIVLLGVRHAGSAYRRPVATAGAAAWAAAVIAIQAACGGGSAGTGPPPAPVASLSPTNLSFPTTVVGSSSSAQNVSLTNTGNASLSINSITASGDFSQTNNCPASLPPGTGTALQACSISVVFTPTAAGTRNGSISVADNASGSPQSVSLTGTGKVVTPAGSYTITINGTSGTLVNSTTAMLVVQ